jgi:hypothetical protein
MKTNYLAIAACAIVNALLGMGWYGIFQKPWMDGHNLTEEAIASVANPALPYIVSIVGALLSGYVLTLIFRRLDVSGWLDGLMSGAAIGLFILVTFVVNSHYSLQPLSLALIDGGFGFLLFSAFGAVIGGWQKR